MPVLGTCTTFGAMLPCAGVTPIEYAPAARWSANTPLTTRTTTVGLPRRENESNVVVAGFAPIGGAHSSAGEDSAAGPARCERPPDVRGLHCEASRGQRQSAHQRRQGQSGANHTERIPRLPE